MRFRGHSAIFLIFIVVTFVASQNSLAYADSEPVIRTDMSIQSYVAHDPIVIQSNDDFSALGFPGDGTDENPYIIAGLEISDSLDGACISISNTSVWFIIDSCAFSSPDFAVAIRLHDVSYAEITRCTLDEYTPIIMINSSAYIEIHDLVPGSALIVIENSAYCHIWNLEISGSPGDGIYIWNTFHFSINLCNITYAAASGIAIDNSSNGNITNCHLLGNSMMQIEIMGNSQHNVIHGNTIYEGPFGIACDDGANNIWDDSVSVGNWWSDYEGTGVYYVPGSALSVDRYPSGPASSTENGTTTPTTDTTTPTTDTSPPSEAEITFWTPMDWTTRTLIAVLLGSSYSGLVLCLAIWWSKRKR